MPKNRTILTDFVSFILHKPENSTLIEYGTPLEREDFRYRILQRLEVGVDQYSILNIHKIGVDVPVKYVFEELLRWSGTSTYWPNQIAHVKRIKGQLENIQIFLFGLERVLVNLKNPLSRFQPRPLFNLDTIRIKRTPGQSDTDNARYLLYKCSGGYPIGIFSIYTRSSIEEQNEREQTQIFFIVAFNFYGKKNRFFNKLINPMWEGIHNRVTANILNMIKQSFEGKFQRIIEEQQDIE